MYYISSTNNIFEGFGVEEEERGDHWLIKVTEDGEVAIGSDGLYLLDIFYTA